MKTTKDLQNRVIFRESVIPLILRIIAIELIIALLHLFLDAGVLGFGMQLHGFTYSVLMSLVPHLLNTVLVVWLVSKWSTTTYTIKVGELIVRTGILHIHESSFAITNFENVSISQSIPGRICNFGTVRVTSPLFKDLQLKNIHNPSYYASLLQATETPVSGRSFLSIAKK